MRLSKLRAFSLTLLASLTIVCAGTQASAATTASFSAQGESLRSVLPRLAKVYNANVSYPPDARGTVNVSLSNATLDQALSAVLEPLGFKYRRENGIIVVYRAGNPANGSTEPAPSVISISIIPVERAVQIVHTLYPNLNVRADKNANAVIVVASPEDAAAIRTILQGLDVRNPTAPSVDAVVLRTADTGKTATELRALFPHANFEPGPNHSVLIRASTADMSQIKQLVASLDVPPAPPSPSMTQTEAVTIIRARPQDVARAVVHEIPSVRADVAGTTVILTGTPDGIARAKTLIAQIDQTPPGAHVTDVYRIHTLDASSVAALLSRSFSNIQVTVDRDLNVITVSATGAEQQRIADAIRQLDQPEAPGGGVQQAGPIVSGPAGTGFEVVTLKSAIPSQGSSNGGATDASTTVIQTLQQLVPSVRVSPLSTPGQIALIGDPVSLRLAKEYLAKLDVPAPLVVLDTEVVEIDETVANNVGLQLNPPAISSTFTESGSFANEFGQTSDIGLQPLTRTPIDFTAVLNLQIQNGNAHVLADPRITTISGRTATIRAGDTLNILTTTGGGAGTIATTQLQSFQTGVTLDITPLVTPGNDVTVALHPVVNSLSGISNGIPQIATRDTQTVVHLKNNQTLVIGGLIESTEQNTINKLPILSYIPVIGGLFSNKQVTVTKNELIIVVTPHVIEESDVESHYQGPGPKLPQVPTPGALPSLPPDAKLPPPSGQLPTAFPPAPPNGAPTQPPGALPRPSPTPAGPGLTQIGGLVVYGKRPDNNIAGPADPPTIFYAALGPAAVIDRTNVSLTAITSTNITNLTASYGTQAVSMGQIRPGEWQALIQFSTTAVPVGSTQVPITLTATRQDGAATSITLPLKVIH